MTIFETSRRYTETYVLSRGTRSFVSRRISLISVIVIQEIDQSEFPRRDGLISRRRCNLSFRSRFVTANALKRTSTYLPDPLIYIYCFLLLDLSCVFLTFAPCFVSLSSSRCNFWSNCISASHSVQFRCCTVVLLQSEYAVISFEDDTIQREMKVNRENVAFYSLP